MVQYISSPAAAVRYGSDTVVFELQCLTSECDSGSMSADVYTYADEYQKIVEHKSIENLELYLIVVAIVILLFSLVYYKYQTTERDSEIESLNYHLTKSDVDIISFQAKRIKNREPEIEELIENGIEMHILLKTALKSSKKNLELLNTLKVKLADSENLIASLTQKNFENTSEFEKRIDTEKSLLIIVEELTNENNSLTNENAKLSLQLEEVINKNKVKESKLLDEIDSLKFELDNQTSALVTEETSSLSNKETLQEVMLHKFNSAENYTEILKSNIVDLENHCSKLETINEESVNKLNSLTKIFKEQQQEYLKQINEKAVLCNNIEGESSDERIKSLNQEILNCKSEIQSLKKEITDQETSFKIKLSAANKKALDYCISFRKAERKPKEMELQTAQLRNKLIMVDNGAKSIDSSKDIEDKLLDIPLPTVCPDFKILDFEPPPPISINQWLPPPTHILRKRLNRSSIQKYNYMNCENSFGHSVESLDK